MATNLAIDDKLIEEAQTLGKHRTKKAAVTQALEEYVERHRQLEILGMFNTVKYERGHDYKKQRKRL